MAYQTGDLISTELSTLNTNINKIRTDQNPGTTGVGTAGFGYGATAITVNPVVGDLVRATEWAAYYQSVNQVAVHQGVTNPLPATALVGDIAYAYPGLNTFINTLTTGRFNIASGNATIAAQGDKLFDTRGTEWDGSVEHRYRATFASWNQARYFFNTGGQIRHSMTHVGGSTSVDTALRAIQSQFGTVVIDYNTFYSLTSSFTPIMSASSGTTTGVINARLNAAPGLATYIEIQMVLTSPSDGTAATGTTSSLVGERRSTNIFNVTGPTYSTTVSLTSGGGVIGPITSVNITGGGSQTCQFNTVSEPSGCFCQWTLSVAVSGGSGSFSYNWSSLSGNYSIVSGQGTTSVVVRSLTTTSNLPAGTIRCDVTDTVSSATAFDTEVVDAFSNGTTSTPPFTSVSISGGGTLSCIYNPATEPAGCYNEWTLTANTVGGSGSFTYTWTGAPNYSIISGQGTSSVLVRSTTNTTATDPGADVVLLSVTDTVLSTIRNTNTGLDSNPQSSGVPISGVSISVTDGGDKVCRWDYDASTYPTSCSVSWTVSANPINGTGPFTYAWTVNTAGYSIASGAGTSTIVVSSSSGTTDLTTLNVSCTITDTSDSGTANSSTDVGAALRRPGPITNVIATASGGNTYECTSSGSPCTVTSTWNIVPVGGSGSFSYSVNEVSDPAGIVTGSMVGNVLTVTSSATGF